MLRSCKYCNRIHDSKVDCGKKPKRKKLGTQQDKFRWTKAWQNKRVDIRERDRNLCQVCKRLLYPYGAPQYNIHDLEVHHIVPLAIDYEARLNNDNLITLCQHHHEMAEQGQIPAHVLLKIAREQEYPPEGNE